ncbi:MAG: hypothetical protein U0264_18835 [Candidatus Kapaibacterium sp.]
MASLKDDITAQSEWIVKAFAADGFRLDYTIDSIVEVDRFFIANMKNGQPKKGGRLYGKGVGPILFSVGSYVGETIIKNVEGADWITDDNDPQGELNVLLKLPNACEIWPIQKVIKRFQNGSEDAIYPYVHMVTKEFTNFSFKEEYWTLTAETEEPEQTKPWWKIW